MNIQFSVLFHSWVLTLVISSSLGSLGTEPKEELLILCSMTANAHSSSVQIFSSSSLGLSGSRVLCDPTALWCTPQQFQGLHTPCALIFRRCQLCPVLGALRISSSWSKRNTGRTRWALCSGPAAPLGPCRRAGWESTNLKPS